MSKPTASRQRMIADAQEILGLWNDLLERLEEIQNRDSTPPSSDTTRDEWSNKRIALLEREVSRLQRGFVEVTAACGAMREVVEAAGAWADVPDDDEIEGFEASERLVAAIQKRDRLKRRLAARQQEGSATSTETPER